MVQFLADNELEFLKQETKIRDRRQKNKLPDKTPEEKLELRSLDSGPFNQKLSDYFEDKEDCQRNEF